MYATQIFGTRHVLALQSSWTKLIVQYWKALLIISAFICLKITVSTNYTPEERIAYVPTTSHHKEKHYLYKNYKHNSIKEIDIISEPPPQSLFLHSDIKLPSKDEFKGLDDQVTKYFDYLSKPSGRCRRLARFGGVPTCHQQGDVNHMDGNKMICLDPEFQLPETKEKNSCLVFSFGISTDTTFDESMMEFNCKLHMFDLFNFTQDFFKDNDRMEFHQTGLGVVRYSILDAAINKSYDYDNLENLIQKNGVDKELMHVLKMDVEGSEWKIIRDMVTKPQLDIVGQIAIEVHAEAMLKATSIEELERHATERLETLQHLEERGFRKVFYADNDQEKNVLHHKGREYPTDGELLLINSNWRNDRFKQQLVEIGYRAKIKH